MSDNQAEEGNQVALGDGSTIAVAPPEAPPPVEFFDAMCGWDKYFNVPCSVQLSKPLWCVDCEMAMALPDPSQPDGIGFAGIPRAALEETDQPDNPCIGTTDIFHAVILQLAPCGKKIQIVRNMNHKHQTGAVVLHIIDPSLIMAIAVVHPSQQQKDEERRRQSPRVIIPG
jgi:hypothetical protein